VLEICRGGWDRSPLANRSPSPACGARESPPEIPFRKPETPQGAARARRLMSHETVTRSPRHPNFCRDLVVEPFSSEERAQLTSWQQTQAPHKGRAFRLGPAWYAATISRCCGGPILRPAAGAVQLHCANETGAAPLDMESNCRRRTVRSSVHHRRFSAAGITTARKTPNCLP
jgi:hypothetical protein